MAHTHGHQGHGQGGKLLWATLLNLVITIVEIVGGLLSNSIALLSDALHNLGDTTAVFIAYIANIIGAKDSNKKKTFGYKRVEILAALLNAIVLLVIIVFLFTEAIKRFLNPEEVKGTLMLIVASIGLIANLVAVLILRKGANKNLNVKAAYLHLIGDTVSSVAVIAGSLCIIFFNIYWVDAVITILVGLYILKETIEIIRDTVDILMQGSPKNINLEEVRKELERIEEIDNIHHVHLWNLSDTQIHFESHIDLASDIKVSDTKSITAKVQELLLNKFGINHVTLQYEHFTCEDEDLLHKR